MKASNRVLLAIVITFTCQSSRAEIRYVDVNGTNATPPYTNWSIAATVIQDAVDAAVDGDEVVVADGVYATGGRAVQGSMTNRVTVDKPLTLRSVNGPEFTFMQGYQVPGTTNGDGAIRCVYLGAGASLFGFTLTNGATRRTGGTFVEYSGGGVFCNGSSALVSNCVMVGNAADDFGGGAYSGTLLSCTLIRNSCDWQGGGKHGGSATNCVFSGNTAQYGGGAAYVVLAYCTLSNNSASIRGGGAGTTSISSTAYDCTFMGNSAVYGGAVSDMRLVNCALIGNTAQSGGGASGGIGGGYLTNCLLIGNAATISGGAVEGGGYGCGLNNCTIVGNSAPIGGGVYFRAGNLRKTLNNCVVYSNTATSDANYSSAILNYSCTTPQPTNGIGNITNAPLFVNQAGGDFRLQGGSPCINAGRNAYAPAGSDLDGNPRIVSGTVDIGAYEFQGVGSLISYAWLQQYGLPTDGSVDFADADTDGHNTWQEWFTDTIPTNSLSVLRLVTVESGATGLGVTWQSVPTRNYLLERATNLAALPPFLTLATNIPGQPDATTYTDTNAVGAGPFFYRVGVQP